MLAVLTLTSQYWQQQYRETHKPVGVICSSLPHRGCPNGHLVLILLCRIFDQKAMPSTAILMMKHTKTLLKKAARHTIATVTFLLITKSFTPLCLYILIHIYMSIKHCCSIPVTVHTTEQEYGWVLPPATHSHHHLTASKAIYTHRQLEGSGEGSLSSA